MNVMIIATKDCGHCTNLARQLMILVLNTGWSMPRTNRHWRRNMLYGIHQT